DAGRLSSRRTAPAGMLSRGVVRVKHLEHSLANRPRAGVTQGSLLPSAWWLALVRGDTRQTTVVVALSRSRARRGGIGGECARVALSSVVEALSRRCRGQKQRQLRQSGSAR